MVWAVVPLKCLAQAKQRLRSELDSGPRAALVEAMARDVLAVLSDHPGIERIILVSNDEALRPVAAQFGAYWMCDPQDADNLNAVMTAVSRELMAQNAASMLVVHADLPLLNRDELTVLLDSSHSDPTPSVTLVPDAARQGTNCLLLSPPGAIDFAYGDRSFSRHRREAERSGIAVRICELPGAAVDVDTAADLDALHRFGHPGAHTQRWLQRRAPASMPAPRSLERVVSSACAGRRLSDRECMALAEVATVNGELEPLMAAAAQVRDAAFGNVITYSRKVFIPLTYLCRDVCHYCTFAKTPKSVQTPFMSTEEVVQQVKLASRAGCREALFTLGEKPELRYRVAREALHTMGFASTLEYVAHVARAVLRETDVLPHINAGCMSAQEIQLLRPVSASMGLMLESASPRLCRKGGPHYGSPDKEPGRRLQTIEEAGRQRVPFTSGILVGIGETRAERIESLLALRRLNDRYGHLQEVIVQNFKAKPNTPMASAREPDLRELLWTVAVARLILGADVSVQVPPNLSPGVLPSLVAAGVNDWGGVSPVTPDYVNPEAPWPELRALATETAAAGKSLQQRLTVYPRYTARSSQWLDPAVEKKVLPLVDGGGLARCDEWRAGGSATPVLETGPWSPPLALSSVSPAVQGIVDTARRGGMLTEQQLVRLFQARGPEVGYICEQADAERRERCGDDISFVVNRNINYTNICSFKCQFCAFSKGKVSENLRGRPYDLSQTEIARRSAEAWARGATEVCMQGGIHPAYDGHTYVQLLKTVRAAAPGLHIHAFSPLEIVHGAQTVGMSLEAYLGWLKSEGLATLPGTAAEILDDSVREIICPDKISTAEWLAVMDTAHRVGLKTTATMMFGHVEGYQHWARHLILIRDQQRRSGGFTEFVPLPFVPMEAPIFRRGRCRAGPTFREVLLVHAVARLALSPWIENIQTSWVKLGESGVTACLNAGANDLGGTLMNESITRAAGATHGQEFTPQRLQSIIHALRRRPRQRNTDYSDVTAERLRAGRSAATLSDIDNTAPDTGEPRPRGDRDALIISV